MALFGEHRLRRAPGRAPRRAAVAHLAPLLVLCKIAAAAADLLPTRFVHAVFSRLEKKTEQLTYGFVQLTGLAPYSFIVQIEETARAIHITRVDVSA